MIRRIHIQNYKALRDVTLDLTPFHVLIGPNDSGKTSILEAIGALCRSAENNVRKCFLGTWQGRDLVWTGDPKADIKIDCVAEGGKTRFRYGMRCTFSESGDQETLSQSFAEPPNGPSFEWNPAIRLSQIKATQDNLRRLFQKIQPCLDGVAYYRFDPRRLALPVGRNSGREFRLDANGFGLALCLEDIRDTDIDRYLKLEQRFKEIFPQIKTIQYRAVSASTADPATRDSTGQPPMQSWGKELLIQFVNSPTPVPASQVSDGLLLVLGYLTILSLPRPARVILIEEPETGIYPRLLQDVVKVLRQLINGQTHTQVVMTTHAPYVLDDFKPEEVTLCRKDPDGSVSVHSLSKNEAIKDQLDIFSLGELWTGPIDDMLTDAKVPAEEPAQ